MTKLEKFRKNIELIQKKTKFQKYMNQKKNFLSVQKKEKIKNKKMKRITI